MNRNMPLAVASARNFCACGYSVEIGWVDFSTNWIGSPCAPGKGRRLEGHDALAGDGAELTLKLLLDRRGARACRCSQGFSVMPEID